LIQEGLNRQLIAERGTHAGPASWGLRKQLGAKLTALRDVDPEDLRTVHRHELVAQITVQNSDYLLWAFMTYEDVGGSSHGLRDASGSAPQVASTARLTRYA
jgi:hypothetical protein